MAFMSFPTFIPKGQLKADTLNRLIDQLEQANKLFAEPPLEITDCSGGLLIRLNKPDETHPVKVSSATPRSDGLYDGNLLLIDEGTLEITESVEVLVMDLNSPPP